MFLKLHIEKKRESYGFMELNLWLFGAFTIYLIHLYSIFYRTFGTIVLSAGMLFLIYYAVKILIMRKKIIKEYRKGLIEEII